MQVHECKFLQQRRRDDASEGNDHGKIDPVVLDQIDEIGEVRRDPKPEVDCCGLDRRRHQLVAAAPAAVRHRDHERDLIACVDEGAQGSYGEIGRTEVRDPPDARRRGNAHGSVKPPVAGLSGRPIWSSRRVFNAASFCLNMGPST